MNAKEMIQRLEDNISIFKLTFSTVSEEDARWKPAENVWSILEVLNHLYDEERDDFRTRIRLTLEDPEIDWPPIDPVGWVTEKDYGSRDYRESLENFITERENSLQWLRGLKDPDWDSEKTHPLLGNMKAGDLLASWVVHDFLHLKQLANLMAKIVSIRATPYSTEYAAPQ